MTLPVRQLCVGAVIGPAAPVAGIDAVRAHGAGTTEDLPGAAGPATTEVVEPQALADRKARAALVAGAAIFVVASTMNTGAHGTDQAGRSRATIVEAAGLVLGAAGGLTGAALA